MAENDFTALLQYALLTGRKGSLSSYRAGWITADEIQRIEEMLQQFEQQTKANHAAIMMMRRVMFWLCVLIAVLFLFIMGSVARGNF